jgi:hypothetical protein
VSNFSQNSDFASSQQKKTRFCFIEAENGSPRNKNEKTHQKAEIKALLRCSKKKPAFVSLKQKTVRQ